MTCCTIANILSRIDFAAFATVIMAIFTGCLVLCNIYLWRSTEKAANAAKISADAAKDSTDDLPKVERAYISVFSIRTNMENWRYAKADQLSPIIIEVCNYGRTPAQLTEIITKMQIDKSDGIVISHGTPDIDEIPDAAGRFIGAEINSVQEFEYPIHIASLIDDWNGLGEGDYYISFSGEIRYKDIFEKDHVAYFNWLLKSRNYERGFYINDPKANYTT